jgi:hypothetical protein
LLAAITPNMALLNYSISSIWVQWVMLQCQEGVLSCPIHILGHQKSAQSVSRDPGTNRVVGIHRVYVVRTL